MRNWKKVIQSNLELITSLAIFWIITIIFLIKSITLNQGHLIYSLDDTYIHMAIAKNFSQYGVWGVTKKEFTSSSSSLLYTLLLSLIFFIFGPQETIPFIINIIFANLLIYTVYTILKKKNLPSYANFIALLLIIFFLPLHSLVFIGMEHILQVIIDVIFIIIASNVLSDKNLLEKKRLSHDDKLLFILSPLITMVRFEGMFLIIIISFLFLLRKKSVYTIIIGGLGFIPIIIYGLISILNGWFFLPNSVVLKGSISDFNTKSIYSILDIFNPMVLVIFPHLLVLFMGALIILSVNCFKKNDVWNKISIISITFIGVLFFHLFFASISVAGIYGSRYDAYLIAIGLILIFISIKDSIPQQLSLDYLKNYFFKDEENFEYSFFRIIAIMLILIFFFTPLVNRSIKTLEDVPQATNNIYEQQYQMGLFLQKYYEGECIVANDIGAINYYANIECLDLRGLGTLETAKLRLNDDELDAEDIYKLAKRYDCKIAIIYEDKDWFEIPSEWVKAGEWKIKDNRVCFDDTVSFFAVDSDEIEDLIEHLRDFSRYLPNTVIESGNYTE